jgi:hypothetical protein
MKRNSVFFALLAIAAAASAQQYVPGYSRNDGTYVQGGYRSAPDQVRSNNLNSQTTGINPYTGQAGHQRDENSSPPQYNQSSSMYVQPLGGTQQRCHRDQFGNTRC